MQDGSIFRILLGARILITQASHNSISMNGTRYSYFHCARQFEFHTFKVGMYSFLMNYSRVHSVSWCLSLWLTCHLHANEKLFCTCHCFPVIQGPAAVSVYIQITAYRLYWYITQRYIQVCMAQTGSMLLFTLCCHHGIWMGMSCW